MVEESAVNQSVISIIQIITPVIAVIIGWALGLISEPAVSYIKKFFQRNSIKKAIFSELKNLVVRLAMVRYKIQTHFGTRTKESLQWLTDVCEKYQDCSKEKLDNYHKLLQLPDREFDALTEISKADEHIAINFKKYSLHFLDRILDSLVMFDSKFQRNLLEISSQIEILNEEIESARYQHSLLFDSFCQPEMKEVIRINIEISYKEVENRCKIIVTKISELIES